MNDDLYQQAILDLARRGAAATRLAGARATATLDTPLCGDRVTIDAALADGRVTAIGHKTRGCALCQASAALLASVALGVDAAALEQGAATVAASLHATGADPPPPWSAFAVFAPLRRHPSRAGCVLLPLEALALALRTPAG